MDRVQNFAQAYSQAPWRKQLQLIGLFSLIVVLTALVAGLHLSVTARAATYGREILEMQTEMEKVELEIADLQAEMALLTASEMMAARARALGFRPVTAEEPMYLLAPGYVERQPAVLAPPRKPITFQSAGLPPEYTESIFEWLQRQTFPSGLLFSETDLQ